MTKKFYLLILAITILSLHAGAQVITTYAGTGVIGFSGDGGPSVAAQVNNPTGICSDASNNLYIADYNNNAIRRISPTGIITTIAGSGVPAYTGDGGLAILAEFNHPFSVAVDGTGNIYISDYNNNVIRKIDPAGMISTFAGTGSSGAGADGVPATASALGGPSQLAIDNSGHVYVADYINNRIRKIDTLTGIITTVAGNGVAASSGDGGPATAASIWGPTGIVVDPGNIMYITDNFGHSVRKVDLSGIIVTVAGNGTLGYSGDGAAATLAQLNNPGGLALDASGDLIISDNHNNAIRMLNTSGIISTIAGTGVAGYTGDCGPATAGTLNNPTCVAVDGSGFVYMTDYLNTVVRKISPSGLPFVGPIIGLTDVCVSSAITVADISPGGTWSMTNGNATISSGGTVTGVTGGLDTVQYAVTNSCGTTTVTLPITVNTIPAVAPITGPGVVCVGDTIVLSDVTPGGSWSATNANATVSTTGVVSGITPGTDDIYYVVTNLCGSSFSSVTVTVNTVPSAGIITGPTTICPGASITLIDGVPGGTWAVTNSNASVTTGGVVTGLVLGIDTTMYIVGNTCGIDTAYSVDTITTTPSAGIITGPDNVCPGATIFMSDVYPSGTWGMTNGNATITSGGVVSGVTAGLDTITYTVILPCGTATATMPITVNALTVPGVISGPTSVCVSATMTLTASVSGGSWNSWNADATVTGTGDVTGVSAGVDSIFYTVFGICGPVTTSYAVTVNPLPFAGFITGPTAVCVGSTITLSDFAPGGFWSAANTNAGVSGTGIVTGGTAGTDDIMYNVVNMCGTAVAHYPITINPLPDAGTISGLTTVCEASSILLTDVGALGTGVWSVVNPAASISSSSGAVTGLAAGNDTALYVYTNMCGSDTATFAFYVNPLPHAAFITGPSVVCVGDTITLVDTASGGVWLNATANTSVGATGVVHGLVLGTDIISYSVTNVCGTAVATHPVTVNDVPVVGPISGLTAVCVGANITLTDPTTGGTWGKSNSSVNVTGGVVTGVSTGAVTISYTLTNMCGSTSSTHTLNVLTIPSAGTIVCPDTICPRVLMLLTDAEPGGIWSISNGHALLDAVGNIDGVTAGLDTVRYTVSNICGSTTATHEVYVRDFSVCDPAYVAPVEPGQVTLEVYPNPNNGNFSLQLLSGVDEPALITITSAVGEKITSLFTNTNKKVAVDLKVAPGIYFVNVATQGGKYITKIVVE